MQKPICPLNPSPLADLFAKLWWELEAKFAHVHTSGAPDCGTGFRLLDQAIQASVNKNIAAEITNYLRGQCPAGWPPIADPVQRQLLVAQRIDAAFALIHPRNLGTTSNALMFPETARRYLDSLFLDGSYNDPRATGPWGAAGTAPLVIPKPPISPVRSMPDGDEEETAPNLGSAAHLGDYFENLQLLAWPGQPAYRKINYRVMPFFDNAVALPRRPRIGFVPLAQARDDLEFKQLWAGGECRVCVSVSKEAAFAERAAKAIEVVSREGAHIAIFPEMCCSPAVVEAIRKSLRETARETAPLLVIAGSGPLPHPDKTEGPPCNAAQVLNRLGETLWTQQKINPHRMQPHRAARMIGPVTEDVAEHFHPGDTLQVRDDLAIGRLMVLICEDFVQDKPGRHALSALRPDWVFVPILDGPVEVSGWVHQETFDAAKRHGCRVIVGNSLVLAALDGSPPLQDCGIGLMVDDERPRRIRIMSPKNGPACDDPIVVIAEWDPDDWPETDIDVVERTDEDDKKG
jgi:predicted amidohydrolase